MNERHNGSSNASGPDPLAGLIRGAGAMPQPSAEFRERLRTQLAGEWQRQLDAKRRRRRWTGAGVAAMFALAVAVTQLLDTNTAAAGYVLRAGDGLQLMLGGDTQAVNVGTTVPAGSRLATGTAPAAFELAAGFNVRLAANTHLAVHGPAHLLLEKGRVYVDSGDVSGALVLDTPFGTVRDIGTQFAVSVHPESLAVQVRDGKVHVQRDTSVVAVAPGERLLVNDAGVTTERVASSGGEWLWAESVAPVLDVQGRSVHAFLEAIHRQTGLDIRYDTPLIARKAADTIIGGQHPDLPPRELLDVVISATDFRHDVTDSTILIHAD